MKLYSKVFFLMIYFLYSFTPIYPSYQNQSINIDLKHYGKDESKKIIVVNKNINDLNQNYPDLKTSIFIDVQYLFTTPVSSLEIGKAYLISDPKNIRYTLYFTELPLVFINTPNSIVDTPGVKADFKLIENDGTIVSSVVKIEIRGASTQKLPKKSYEFEFHTDNSLTKTQDFRLLNMREDDDWILQALFNEPLRVNSKISFDFWRQIHTLYYQEEEPNAISGIHLEFTELFLNGSFKGIYALGEKSDRKQLKIKKLKNGNIRGELVFFDVIENYDNSSLLWEGYEYKYPKDNINWKNLYDFINFVVNEPDVTFYSNVESYFNIDNAVDYFIFLNVTRAADNRGKNAYLAKYNTDEPYFYSPWDLDATFGYKWNNQKLDITNDILTNSLYNRLLQDTRPNGFKSKLEARWHKLRNNGIITHNNIMNLFNNNITYLKDNAALDRENIAWPEYEFNNLDLDYVSRWLRDRINFLDLMFNPDRDCETLIALIDTPSATIVNDWTYYSVNAIKKPLFAIEKTPNGVGANTNVRVEASVMLKSLKKCTSSNSYYQVFGENSIISKGLYWNVKLNIGTFNGWVNIRWFTDDFLEEKLTEESIEMKNNILAPYISSKIHFRIKKQPLSLPKDFRNDAKGLNSTFEPLLNRTIGTYNGYNYIQYNQIENINNTGGGIFITITNENEYSLGKSRIKGAIRYNQDLKIFQGFDGVKWVNFN